MGTCCYENQPSEKFVGTWTDNEHVKLTIAKNGNIQYLKETAHTKANFAGPTRFKDNDFCFCCCCCCLRGKYSEEDSEPKLITNGTVLTRK